MEVSREQWWNQLLTDRLEKKVPLVPSVTDDGKEPA